MAGIFSQSTLERVRSASDIVDVIGSYLPLKRAGANFTALCPFHKEKSPSFNVNPHRQIFHCFGCHKGGDVFSFVREYENIGFADAVRRLADRAKIPLEYERGGPDEQTRHLKDQLLEVHEQLTQRWQSCLQNEAAGQVARDYLAKRGVGEEAMKVFRIGAAPESWDDTVNWAKGKNFDLELVEKAGLIVRKGSAPATGAAVDAPSTANDDEASSATREGARAPQTPDAIRNPRHFYDRFRGRLMFPICDEQGRVIAFSGRVLPGDDSPAKYVNSPETPIFTKSKVFFGLDKSKRAILDAGFAIVCEGQLDLIACFMAGVQNIVAPQGTAFTDQHARIIKRYVDEVVLCFDSDEAGQNATVRSLDSLLASGLAVRVAVVPAPHDPDSFIKANGAEGFKQLIAGADGFFDYYLKRLCAQNDIATDKGQLAVLREMGEAVRKTGNAVLMDSHAQKTANRLGVATDAVRAEFKKAAKAATAKPQRETQREETPEESSEELEPVAPPTTQEFWLLKLALLHDDSAEWLAAHLDPQWIVHPVVREILSARVHQQMAGEWRGLASFLDGFESAHSRSMITEATAENRAIPNPEQQLADLTLRLRNQFIDRQLAALSQSLHQPEIPEEESTRLLQQQQRLREMKRHPLSPLGDQ